MPAKLRPIGHLKSLVNGQAELDVESGFTIRATLENAGIRSELVALVMVNDEQRDKDYVLQEGDVVKVMAVIGGG
ncbi:MAG: MoaD/ThiS family protein [Chloroflexi bacterium]|nr:MoaD/ThiS family protein [Chloroflexota bacterium]